MTIDNNTDIAAFAGRLEHLDMLSLAPTHNRSQKLKPRPLRQLHDLICHLIDRLRIDLLPTLRTMRNTDPRIQKAEIVVNLRHRTNRGTRVTVRRLLIDRDRRRQSLNGIHIRLIHLSQKLAGIRRQRLHITSLPLCVDRIKCQRRLPGTTESGKYNKLVSRHVQIDLLQIVLCCLSYLYIFL